MNRNEGLIEADELLTKIDNKNIRKFEATIRVFQAPAATYMYLVLSAR